MSEAYYISSEDWRSLFSRWVWADERFFDPSDYIKTDVLEWLDQYAGPNRWNEQMVKCNSGHRHEFGFLDRRAAILFKLRYDLPIL